MTKMKCFLCRINYCKEESHIISKFAYKWLKDTSVTNYIRMGGNVNVRVQDGIKIKLLCEECEDLFNKWETTFANKIFYPLHKSNKFKVNYKDWLSKFAVSISWRVLIFHKMHSKFFKTFTDDSKQFIDRALELWGNFLLGKKNDIGKFDQHLFIISGISLGSNIDSMPININRYLLRSVDCTIAYSPEMSLVYTKMGMIIILGFIQGLKQTDWKNTKLRISNGIIESHDNEYYLPDYIINFILKRADQVCKVQKGISKKQKEAINQTIRKDMIRAEKSESIKALELDVKLFGNKVFDND